MLLEQSERENGQHLRETFRSSIKNELSQFGTHSWQTANEESLTLESDLVMANHCPVAASQKGNATWSAKSSCRENLLSKR